MRPSAGGSGVGFTCRLTRWSLGSAITATTTQDWTLSAVGDWQQVKTVSGGATTTDSRTHTPVHEIASINNQTILHDGRGNLTRDAQGQTFAWDADGHLASANALAQGRGGSASYRYDALGRRVASTVVNGATTTTTWYVSAGPQVVSEIVGDLAEFNDPTADPELAGAAPFNPVTGTGARGSLLADPLAQRYNVQPVSTDTPDGWLPDTGATAATASVRGWSTAVTPVDRDALGRPLYDTTAPVGTATWSIPVANGTHAVVIMCGDASSRAQTNHLLVNGTAVTDTTPYNPNEVPGYETGSFDGYALTVPVTDGFLRIKGNVGGVNPKVCFVEIGAVGSSVDQATIDRVTKAAADATKATGFPRPGKPPEVRRLVYGSYVDELLSYTVQKPRHAARRFFVHNNSLYSPQAVADAGGAVVERYTYDAYGLRMANGTSSDYKSSIGMNRGFTGYQLDEESGLYYARARMYSPTQGRFASRDPMGYVDGMVLYAAYYVPNKVDPTGRNSEWHAVADGGSVPYSASLIVPKGEVQISGHLDADLTSSSSASRSTLSGSHIGAEFLASFKPSGICCSKFGWEQVVSTITIGSETHYQAAHADGVPATASANVNWYDPTRAWTQTPDPQPQTQIDDFPGFDPATRGHRSFRLAAWLFKSKVRCVASGSVGGEVLATVFWRLRVSNGFDGAGVRANINGSIVPGNSDSNPFQADFDRMRQVLGGNEDWGTVDGNGRNNQVR